MVGAQPGGTVIVSGGGSSGGGGTGGGTVTSVAMSVPTGFKISGSPITSAGTLALTFTSGYALPTTADVSKGVTAYGWGNHADAGYLTSSSLNGYATQQWVGQQGFLTSGDLSGYATQQWVGQQGFLTSSDLSGYATQQWVGQQGFLTSSDLSGYATQQWVQQQGFITVDGGTFLGDRSLLFGADDGHAGGIYWQSTSPNVGDVVIDATGNIAFTINGGIVSGDITNSKFQISSAGCMLLSALQAFPYTVSDTTYYRITLTDANGITISGRRLFIGNSYLQITNSGGGSVTQQADGDTYKFTANPNSGGQSGVTSFLFNKKVTAADGFAKTGSSDSEVLLAGGGTKALTDFLETSGGTVTGNIRMSQLNKLMFGYDDSPNYIQFDANDDALYFHGGPDGYVFETTGGQGDANFRCNIYANNVNNNSDARLKNIVSHAGFEVDKLATLPLVWFTWKKDERRRMHFGSIAQEWQKVLPEVVSENGDGMLAMDYGAAAMAAGVTACREIVRLKAEIERLKKRLN